MHQCILRFIITSAPPYSNFQWQMYQIDHDPFNVYLLIEIPIYFC